MTDLAARLGAALAGRYRIGRELGRGGMATVYLADDLKHDRQVAIKVLRPELVHGALEPRRFLREIRTAARLTHPHILPLHDSGEAAGLLYFVSPAMSGETLRGRLAREGRLPLDETIRIARAVAAALDYAHRAGVVHRDVKPENILLHEGQPIVADFGIARAAFASTSAAGERETLSSPGQAVGTPAYMSPEQIGAGDGPIDGRSDQYALACVVYEMLAGRPPFARDELRATLLAHLTAPPPSIAAHRPELPAAAAAVLRRALAKEPTARFATAGEFVEALAAAAAPVWPPSSSGAVSGSVATGAGGAPRAVAVLPFVNASADAENGYLSDGMTEELIDALSRVEGLHVASRSTVFAFRDAGLDARAIGTRLDVPVVLEGSVRRAGDRLRILAQLTRVADGRVLWSARYDRELTDVFALQDELARTIVAALRPVFPGGLGDPTPRRYTESVRAYTLYLKGRWWWSRRTRQGLEAGIRFFERAIAEDPGFALAYTGLADSYALQVDYRGAPVADGMHRAKAEALRALALDEGLAEAHTSLAWVTFIYDWDLPAAEREFRRAIELNPGYATAHHWYSWCLLALGRTAEALAEGRAAVELDPTSPLIRMNLGWLAYYARDYEAALEHLRRALALDPHGDEIHRIMGLVYLQRGDPERAAAAFREAIAVAAEEAYAVAGLVHAEAARGRRAEAEALLARLEARAATRYVSPVAFAMAWLGLGDHDRAFEWLERALEERRGWLVYLRVEPLLDPLRGDPRLERLAERVGPVRAGA